MNKLLTTLFALAVASVTAVTAVAQAPAPAAAPAKVGTQAQAGAKSLEAKVAMCIGCHGIKGYQASFPEVYRVPMISGQNAKYIAAALTAYKAGDRKHPTMRGIADSLTEQDISDIAGYYSTNGAAGPEVGVGGKQASQTPSPQVAALLQKAACASCHGADFSKPIENYPKIAGQHNDYLFAALRAYKTDNNPTSGRNNAVMGAIARQFSNAELKLLANYMASLDGELKSMPEPRFR
jgi:cytochrome c553